MDTSAQFEPSLALVHVDLDQQKAALACDLKEPVCMCEKTDICSHRYITKYLPEWCV